jgi:hypothetical protein
VYSIPEGRRHIAVRTGVLAGEHSMTELQRAPSKYRLELDDPRTTGAVCSSPKRAGAVGEVVIPRQAPCGILAALLGFGDNPSTTRMLLRCGETVPLAGLAKLTTPFGSQTRGTTTWGCKGESRWSV